MCLNRGFRPLFDGKFHVKGTGPGLGVEIVGNSRGSIGPPLKPVQNLPCFS